VFVDRNVASDGKAVRRLRYKVPQSPLSFAIRGNVPVDEHIARVGVNYKFTNCLFLFSCGAKY